MSSVPTAQHIRLSRAEAAGILASRDPVLAELVEAAGPIHIGRRGGSHFAGLVEAIVYQQLAGAAAAAIHRRLVAARPGVEGGDADRARARTARRPLPPVSHGSRVVLLARRRPLRRRQQRIDPVRPG
jgi:hypothetical protein